MREWEIERDYDDVRKERMENGFKRILNFDNLNEIISS
jgi:hypothetical protein